MEMLDFFHKHHIREENAVAAFPVRLWISAVDATFISWTNKSRYLNSWTFLICTPSRWTVACVPSVISAFLPILIFIPYGLALRAMSYKMSVTSASSFAEVHRRQCTPLVVTQELRQVLAQLFHGYRVLERILASAAGL